jgi:hypothetical protein
MNRRDRLCARAWECQKCIFLLMSNSAQRSYTHFTPERQAAFLDRLADGGNVMASAMAVGVTRATVYAARDRDDAFAEAWDDALERYAAALENELHKRVFEGVQRPIFQRGELVGHEALKSDRLLEIALKAHRPDRYSERFQASIDHTVKAGVLMVPATMSLEEWTKQFVRKDAETKAD